MAFKAENQSRFAIYCGNGVYVQAVNHRAKKTTVTTGCIDGAMCASRVVAIAALHVARRAGLGAWLVQHPEFATVQQQVAA